MSDEPDNTDELDALEKRLRTLHKTFNDFRICGDGVVDFDGSLMTGISATFGGVASSPDAP